MVVNVCGLVKSNLNANANVKIVELKITFGLIQADRRTSIQLNYCSWGVSVAASGRWGVYATYIQQTVTSRIRNQSAVSQQDATYW